MIDLERFLEECPDLFCVVDQKGYFERTNSKWEELLGYTQDDLSKRPFADFVHPEDLENTLQTLDTLKTEGAKVSNFTIRYIKKSGGSIWLKWTAIHSKGLIYAMARDISELKQNENFYLEMQEATQMGNWRYDLSTHEITWSEQMYLIHEVPMGEPVSPEMAREFYPNETREMLDELVSNCIQLKRPYDVELPFITATGRRRWVRAVGKPNVSAGRVDSIYGVFHDITEKKLSQMIASACSEVRESYLLHKNNVEAIYSCILQSSLACTESDFGFFGQVLSDEDGNKYLKTYALTDISWNPETKKIYEEEQQQKGMIFSKLESLYGWVLKNEKPLLTNDPPHHIESTGTPYGHPPLQNFLGYPIMYDGKIIAMLGLANRGGGYDEFLVEKLELFINVVGDILEHIRLDQFESDMRQQERVVIQNERLASIGELAAGVGHEINNPLTISLMCAEQVLEKMNELGVKSAKVTELIERQARSLERIRDIVDGLRTFARRSTNELSVCTVGEVINSILQLVSQIYSKYDDIRIVAPGPGTDIKVKVDFSEIQQVLMNLMSNARDALEGCENKFILLQIKEDKEAGKVWVRVEDNGQGISPEEQDKIFDSFYTTKEVGKGTGLGLSLTKKIIIDHGGAVRVQSEPGQGSCFEFSLPIFHGEKKPLATPPAEDKKQVEEHSLAGYSLIIVDDEEGIRELLAEELRDLELKVTTASSGKEALHILEKQKFDFLLTDVKMPQVSGPELIATLVEKKVSLPKIFLISGGMKDEWKIFNGKDISRHVTNYIQKPFLSKDIVTAFRKAL